MANLDDFNTKIDVISAVTAEREKKPTMPVDVYAQETENLHHWARIDRKTLTAAGLKWIVVEDLLVLAGALREAESRWFTKRFTKEEAQRQWKEQ